MKKEILEEVLKEAELDLIEETADADRIRKKGIMRRPALLAAAALMLIGAGWYLLNSSVVKKPDEVPDTAGKETGELLSNTAPDSYKVAFAAYPASPEAALGKSGIIDEYQGILTEYTRKTADRFLAESIGKNTVYSPANLYLAISMLTETADHESRRELLDLMGVTDVRAVRELSNAIWLNLYRTDKNGSTALANSLWLNNQIAFRQSTVDTLAEDYFADVFSVPMGDGITDQVLQKWINERTNHLLGDAGKKLQTTKETAAVLVSALYYKDSWHSPFLKQLNTSEVFTAADGRETETEFMHQRTVTDAYCQKDGRYTVAAIPFESRASMVFLLPDEGVSLQELLEQGEVTEGLLRWNEKLPADEAEVQWSIPKFDIQSELSLTGALNALGVRQIFDRQAADFSPLTETGNDLYISQIMHAGRVKVDEYGCEAAAFTAVSYNGGVWEDVKTIHMNLNRPFAFMITGVDGLPLFIGVVNEV